MEKKVMKTWSRPNSRLLSSCFVAGLLLVLITGSVAFAQNYDIIRQDLDAKGHGYTVMRVWGSHHEMGFAFGAALADDVVLAVEEIKTLLGGEYENARAAIAPTVWLPAGVEQEITGIVEGVKSQKPDAAFDEVDIKLLNTFGDWSYFSGCRSHSCWGSYVQGPVKTLSTRRLDYRTPFDRALHHVLVAWDPSDGSIRWVNLAWPGYVAVVTGVNAHGTLVSLHDYNSTFVPVPGGMTRCAATRYVLTGVGVDMPIQQQLTWAQSALAERSITTGTFINYYVPEGHGGVFTCAAGGGCGQARVPNPAYFGGEVLITTNSQTDGSSVPGGGEFMDDYYKTSKPKDLKSHFELMGQTGLHLLSVAYRGEQDMTIWINGRGRDDRLEFEWSELFPADTPDAGLDADGAGGADDGVMQDSGQSEDEGDDGVAQDSEQGTDDSDSEIVAGDDRIDKKEGCSSCNATGSHAGFEIWIFLGFLLVWASSKSNQERNR